MKYIDAEKLIAEIERLIGVHTSKRGQDEVAMNLDYIKEFITSLQQEQPETDMKSPFTGGKVAILSREEEVTFRGEKIKVTRKYYRCEDTGREFTDSKLDDDMMWAVFRAYCEKKGMTSFTDIMLKQEQPDVDMVPLQEEKMVRYINYCLQREDDDCNCPNCGKYVTGLRLFPYYYDRENNDVYFASVCPECGKIIISKE